MSGHIYSCVVYVYIATVYKSRRVNAVHSERIVGYIKEGQDDTANVAEARPALITLTGHRSSITAAGISRLLCSSMLPGYASKTVIVELHLGIWICLRGLRGSPYRQ